MRKRGEKVVGALVIMFSFLVLYSLGIGGYTAEAQSFEELVKRIKWQENLVERVTKPSKTPVVEGEKSGVRDGIPYSTELDKETPGWTPPEGWEIVKTEGKVDKLVWLNFGGLEYDPATVANQKTFEKITGIKIENVVVPDEAGHPKAVATLKAQSGALEVIPVLDWGADDFYREGWLETLDFLWSEELAKHYNPSSVDRARYKGHFYATTFVGRVMEFMYRKDLLQEAVGHDRPPQTWQELIDYAKAMHKVDENGNVIRYGFGFFTGRVGALFQFHSLLFTQGLTHKDILNEEGVPQYNTPEGVRALQFMIDLVQKHKVSPQAVGTYGDTDVYQMFISDKAAMINTHSWSNFKIASDLKAGQADSKAATNWGIFVWPKCGGWMDGPEGVSVPRIESHVVGINKYADPWKKVAGALYLDYLRSYYAYKYETAYEQNVTFMKDIYEDPYVKENTVAYPLIKEAVTSGQAVYFWQQPAVNDIMLKYVNKAIAGEMTAKAALDAAQEEIEELITGF